MQFKQYSAGITFLYVDTFRRAFRGLAKTDAERAEARRQLAGLLAMQFGATGLLGLPLARTAGILIEAAVHAFDEEDDWSYEAALRQASANIARGVLGDYAGTRVARAMTKGAFDGFTPASLHGRLSISELWMREPYRDLEGRANATYLLEELAGPAYGIVSNVAGGVGNVLGGEYARGIEQLTPKVVGDGFKALRYAVENPTTRGGSVIIDTRPDEVVLQALGFSPSRLSDRYDQNRETTNAERAIERRRSAILKSMVDARRDRDLGAARSAQGALREFNRKFPSYRIEKKNIEQSARSRERAEAQMDGGARRNPRLRDALGFDFSAS